MSKCYDQCDGNYCIDKSYTESELHDVIVNSKHPRFNIWPGVTHNNAKDHAIKAIFDNLSNTEVSLLRCGTKPIGIIGVIPLDWDSAFFGFKCAKISFICVIEDLGMVEGIQAKKYLVSTTVQLLRSKFKLLIADVDSQDSDLNQVLQDCGFKYILSWVDGFYNGSEMEVDLPQNHKVEVMSMNDLGDMLKIVREDYFLGGRFYMDHCFHGYNISSIYESLVLNSIKDSEVMVYKVGCKVVGFFIAKKTKFYPVINLNYSHLRLLATDHFFRGQGIASNLYKCFINHLLKTNDVITTGLEVHNVPSLNLHSKLGFKFNYVHNAYHLWNPDTHITERS